MEVFGLSGDFGGSAVKVFGFVDNLSFSVGDLFGAKSVFFGSSAGLSRALDGLIGLPGDSFDFGSSSSGDFGAKSPGDTAGVRGDSKDFLGPVLDGSRSDGFSDAGDASGATLGGFLAFGEGLMIPGADFFVSAGGFGPSAEVLGACVGSVEDFRGCGESSFTGISRSGSASDVFERP